MFRIFLCGLLIAGTALAQSFDRAKLDQYFQLLEANNKGMGQVSFMVSGQEVYQNAFGFANVQTNQKANTQTKYRIGSISKSFTATLIMQLVEAGKLSLEDPLAKYFPEIPNAGEIRIKDLLQHSSGIYNITDDPELRTWIYSAQSREQMLNRIAAGTPQFDAGAQVSYSNSNYILLSFILEDAYGMNYGAVLEKQIIIPLGLTETRFGGSIQADNNEALPYYYEDEAWQQISPHTHLNAPMGAGGIVSTAKDVSRFYAQLFSGALVSENTLKMMIQTREDVGLGIMGFPFEGIQTYGHSGSIDGFQSLVAHFPDQKITISAVSNYMYTNLTQVMIGAAKIFFGMEYELPEFESKRGSETSQLYAGAYSSSDFPLPITIFWEADQLKAQAEGRTPIALVLIDEHHYLAKDAGLEFMFNVENKTMLLKEGRREFRFNLNE